MKKLITAGFASSLLLSTSIWAHSDEHNYSISNDECSVDLNYGVIVEDDSIRFIDGDNTFVQINNNYQLFVRGKEIALTPEQQATITQYANGVNEQVPEIVHLAIDAVEVALNAVNEVVIGLELGDTQSSQRIDDLIIKVKEQVHARFNDDNDSYFIAEQNFDEFEQLMEEELGDEIEQIVSDSVGNILIAVGKAMNSEEGSFEQKMEAFGERMERMGENIEIAVEAKAEKLGEQAEKVCSNLKVLEQLETKLSDNIQALSDFDLINISD